MHPLLEHPHPKPPLLPRDRQPGLQPALLQEPQRASKHPWVFLEPNNCLEVPINEEASDPHWPHLQGPLPLSES